MPRTEIRIAGFGGQGVILAGVLLGRAAVLHGGRYAIQTQTYGAAARGGAARSDVIIDDVPIIYPGVTSPDVMVTLTNQALDKYRADLRDDAVLIVDGGLVSCADDGRFDLHSVNATSLAVREFGRGIVANMIMLGYLTAVSGVVDASAVEEAVRGGVPRGTEEMNLAAFGMGVGLACAKGDG